MVALYLKSVLNRVFIVTELLFSCCFLFSIVFNVYMNLQRLCFCLLLNLYSVFAVYAVNLQAPPLYEAVLTVPGTLADKTFGARFSVSGYTAAIAALPSSDRATGSVYLYNAQEDWRLAAELNSLSNVDNFAQNIVLEGHILIVSADRDDQDTGAVYVFERNSLLSLQPWRQTAKIIAPDKLPGDRFGSAIALSGDALYIGAPSHDQGKVYVFQRNPETGQWLFLDSIAPKDPQALMFGASIARDREILIVGAPYTDASDNVVSEAKRRVASNTDRQRRFAITKGLTDDPGLESGAIFVYHNNSGVWQQTARLGASNRETGDHLGMHVAIEGDYIVASVKQKDIFDFLRAGAVYIYKRQGNEWLEDTALFAQKNNIGANFGNSFILLDEHIMVGANKIHFNGFNSGQAYLYARNTNGAWELKHLQHNTEIKAHDQFGLTVALSEKFMLVASKHAVYVFQDTPVNYYPAVFYPSSNTVKLNEVSVNGLGILQASFHLSQKDGEFIITLLDSSLRTDMDTSEINYLGSSELLVIPRLAFPKSNGETVFLTVTLQQILDSSDVQFRVVSISPLEP